MADHIDIDVKNPAKGSADFSALDETNAKIKKFVGKIDAPKNADVSLEAMNSVVGNPEETDVPVKDLISPPHEWLSLFKKAGDDDIYKMAASIYRYGLLHRVTLWKNKDDKYTILGGTTRVAAYKHLDEIYPDDKWAKIPAKVYSLEQLDEIDAKRIFIVSNTDQRRMSVSSVANAYYQLVKLEKDRAFYGSGIYSRDAAAKQAGVSLSSFNNYLKLSELYSGLLDMVDQNKLQLSAAYELAYASEDIQKYVFDKGYYINLKRKTARRIAKEANAFVEVDKIISESTNKSSAFRYRVNVPKKLPRNCEILPIFVDKKLKDNVIDALKNAVGELDIPNKAKKHILKSLGK